MPLLAKSVIQGHFPLWPEKREPVVNVLCEGPSLLELEGNPKDLLLGPVVAINRALACRGVRADFWATSDPPSRLWAWSEPWRREGLRFWTTDNNVPSWAEFLGEDLPGLYAHEETLLEEVPERVILPTLISLLGWLSGLDVRCVRIFGADFRGSGSPLSPEGFSEEQGRAWAWRWRVERVLLAHAMRRFREGGMRLDRFSPWRSACRPRPSKSTISCNREGRATPTSS